MILGFWESGFGIKPRKKSPKVFVRGVDNKNKSRKKDEGHKGFPNFNDIVHETDREPDVCP